MNIDSFEGNDPFIVFEIYGQDTLDGGQGIEQDAAGQRQYAEVQRVAVATAVRRILKNSSRSCNIW